MPKLPKFKSPHVEVPHTSTKGNVSGHAPEAHSSVKSHVDPAAKSKAKAKANVDAEVNAKAKANAAKAKAAKAKAAEVNAKAKAVKAKGGTSPRQTKASTEGAHAGKTATPQELKDLKAEHGGDITKPGKMQKTKKFVMKHAGKIFGGLGIAIVASIAIAGAVNKQKCFAAWQEKYRDLWDGGTMRDTKDTLQTAIKSRGAEPSDARVDEAYAELARCDDEDILAHFIAGAIDTIVVPVVKGVGDVAGTVAGDVLAPIFGPFGKALESFAPVFVVLACIVALGVAYKIYTVFQDGRGSSSTTTTTYVRTAAQKPVQGAGAGAGEGLAGEGLGGESGFGRSRYRRLYG